MLMDLDLNSFPTSYKEIKSQWIVDENMRVKTIKLSQENTGISLCDFGLGIDFLI
jgi:hypothetical protein